jgi:hypothetical protein
MQDTKRPGSAKECWMMAEHLYFHTKDQWGRKEIMHHTSMYMMNILIVWYALKTMY